MNAHVQYLFSNTGTYVIFAILFPALKTRNGAAGRHRSGADIAAVVGLARHQGRQGRGEAGLFSMFDTGSCCPVMIR